MALDALERRNISEIHGMLESVIALMTNGASEIRKSAQVDGMFERSGRCCGSGRTGGIGQYAVTNSAVVAHHLTGVAHVIAIMTTKTAGKIEVSDIVWMRLPINSHLRKNVRLKDPFYLTNCFFYGTVLSGVDVLIVNAVKLVHTRFNRSECLIRGTVGFVQDLHCLSFQVRQRRIQPASGK